MVKPHTSHRLRWVSIKYVMPTTPTRMSNSVKYYCLFRCSGTCERPVVLHHPACAYVMNFDPVPVQNPDASVDWILTETNLCSHAFVGHGSLWEHDGALLMTSVQGCLSTPSRSRCKHELLVEPTEEYTYIKSSTPLQRDLRHPTNTNTPLAWHVNTQSHSYMHTDHTPTQPTNAGPTQACPNHSKSAYLLQLSVLEMLSLQPAQLLPAGLSFHSL